jgi:hypothetical protein
VARRGLFRNNRNLLNHKSQDSLSGDGHEVNLLGQSGCPPIHTPRFLSRSNHQSSHPVETVDIPAVTLEWGFMFKVASWNLNSVRSRLFHVTAWLKDRQPDVLLLQELKGTEFPSEAFNALGYESVAVTQKAYNGVAILCGIR